MVETHPDLISSFFIIFSGAAVLATFALYTRQPLLVAYIALGALLGPYGFKAVSDPSLLKDISQIGIIFLLFLLGLDLQPRNLIDLIRKTTFISVISAFIFTIIGTMIAKAFGFSTSESVIIGITMIFSSTIIGIKLLPTTVLHHKHIGELVVSLLLFQDFIAIFVLIFLYGGQFEHFDPQVLIWFVLSLPGLGLIAYLFVRFVLLNLLKKFDRIHEYIFLVAIGWCLGMAELATKMGLSHEIGAFIAGISLASSPISLYIANHLKPLRDFFLILFFFSLGASFNLGLLQEVLLPSFILATAMLIIKPFVYRWLLLQANEDAETSTEIGFRLGQTSEFSLLIAYIASSTALISDTASHTIQATAIITFLASTYLVIFRYPTPLALSDKLRRD